MPEEQVLHVHEKSGRSQRSRYYLVTSIILAVAICDQITKFLIMVRFPENGRPLTVIPGLFNICHTRNTGVVFGLFPGIPGVFVILTILAIIVLLFILKSLGTSASRLQYAAYGLIIGGALGNLIDRIRLGSVTDFLDFYLGTHHWPAFNVADSAVCVGVGLVLLSTFLETRAQQEQQTDVSS